MVMTVWIALNSLAKADLSAPTNSLGSSGAYGNLLLWTELDEADYGDDLRLPVRVAFNSTLQNESQYLGRNFWVPLAEAKAYPYSERLMRVELICGQTIFLRKDLKNPNQYSSMDGKTIGLLDGNRFVLTEPNGWISSYKDGRIWQLQADTGRILTWYYRNNITTEIKDERNGRSAFQVEYGTNGKPNGFSVNGKRHGFEMGKKPRVEYIENKRVVGAMDDALSIWEYPDGKKDLYEFAVTKDLNPTLKCTDKDGLVNNYQWDAKTGWIVSDSGWKYKVESNGSGMRPKLRRYNDKGQEEFVIVDNRNGVFQQKDIKEGTRVTEVFRTPGPLYGKVRKIENMLPDGTKKLVYQAAYDERGRKIRTIDEQGTSMVFKYNPSGKLIATRTSLSADFLTELKKKETQLLAELEKEKNQGQRGGMLHELWIFYVVEMRDIKKAAALLNVIKGGESRFSLKLSLIISNPDMVFERRNAQLTQLIQEYPDKREYIENLITKD